jgi:hypothetical protein
MDSSGYTIRMKPKILLVNPPIYDFSAYDFWLKPYGMLQAAGQLEGQAEMVLFDYLDPIAAEAETGVALRKDPWHRGPFPQQRIGKPPEFSDIPRHLYRFGRDRERFVRFLSEQAPFDLVLIQTVMSYWYLGIKEVIEDVRRICPNAKIVLGGVYATLCPDHACGLGADIVISGSDLSPIFNHLNLSPPPARPPAWWKGYPRIESAAIKITQGCPFRCSYCSVALMGESFAVRPIGNCVAELKRAIEAGAEDVAFYDDALLAQPEKGLLPFLDSLRTNGLSVNFHTPNALHCRFLTRDIARQMAAGGFQSFYLGFESASADWHRQTGGKVTCGELADAVEHLRSAGVHPRQITAYQIIGHPDSELQQAEATMAFIHSLGIRIMLAEFSPIPGTPDGDRCQPFTDLSEPLNHNKTAFAIRRLGFDTVGRLKDLCRKWNGQLPQ